MLRMVLRQITLLLFLLPVSLFGQDPKEGEGYFTDPKITPYGIVCSNNYGSALYIIQSGSFQELLSAPGCGNYTTLSSDRSRVGLKLVNEDGSQTPAIFDLTTRTVQTLSAPGKQMGQVSFTADGRIAFTRGEELVLLSNGVEQTYPLGTYANIAPISPDGHRVVYNDRDDQLWLLNLETLAKAQITDGTVGYYNPIWSADGSKLLYCSLNGMVRVHDFEASRTYDLGDGVHPSWSENSRDVVFHRREFQGPQLVNTDLFLSSFDGAEVQKLTSTQGIMEMDPSFAEGGTKVVFHTFVRRSIGEAGLASKGDAARKLTAAKETALPGPGEFAIKPLSLAGSAHNLSQLDIPYVHQAYDTPDWFNGDWACAPTQAIMLLAYYNVLPPWPTPCSTPSFHYNNWGNYVSTQYQFRQAQYIQAANDASGRTSWGGYGYMWNGAYSPHTRMADYFRNHGFTAVQSEGTPYSIAFSEVSDGHPFSMCVMLTTAGHLVLAHGIGAEPHTFVFNDPWGNKNRGYKNYYGKNSSYDWPGYNNGFQNLTGVAWCIATRYEPLAASDTVIDDQQFEHGFSMQTAAPSSMSYWKDKNAGYQGHAWFAYTRGVGAADVCFATWTPVLPDDGKYEVSAFIPSFSNSTDARYSITSNEGTALKSINQNENKDSWALLGAYSFAKGSAGSVRLGDVGTTDGQVLGFDAVRWSRTLNLATAVLTAETPRTFALFQNYPNPFNPTTAISYQLPALSGVEGSANSFVKLRVFDVLGREVASLVNEIQKPGSYVTRWDGSGYATGVYLYRLQTGDNVQTKKMVFLK